MVQNRLDITVHQFQGFPWRYLHQISPVKLQVEIGRPETHRVETGKETAKVQAATDSSRVKDRQRGREVESESFSTLVCGKPQLLRQLSSAGSRRGWKGRGSAHLRWFLPPGSRSALGFALSSSDWMPEGEWAHLITQEQSSEVPPRY